MVRKIFSLLSLSEKKEVYGLLVLMAFSGLLEAIGVASIFPFIAIVSGGDIQGNQFLIDLASKMGFSSNEKFVIFFGAVFFTLFFLSLVVRAYSTYWQQKFVHMRQFSISRKITQGYLNHKYKWFLSRHTADLGKTILSEVRVVTSGSILPVVNFASQFFVAVFIIAILVLINPYIATLTATSLLLCYVLIFYTIKRRLFEIGKQRLSANEIRYKVLSEVFGGIKQVKVNGLSQIFMERFSTSSEIYARRQASAQVLNFLPRYVLEGISIGLMLLLILWSKSKGMENDEIFPLVTLFVFAGYRLLPALQSGYSSLAQMRVSSASLNDICLEMEQMSFKAKEDRTKKVRFERLIELDRVFFKYPDADNFAIKDVSLSIPIGAKIAIVGRTGGGKTTLVDLILGLVEPDKGSLLVDEILIGEENLQGWQDLIAYVPQSIFLLDDTISANIAFGKSEEEICQKEVERVAKIAQIHEFINSDLPLGYMTKVGESGVRLSGGQKQRIGIARALYRNPSLLVLDEATSALDNITEKDVMDSLVKFYPSLTVLMIAHRLKTIQHADEIFLVDRGKVVDKGSYNQLLNSSDIFFELTKDR